MCWWRRCKKGLCHPHSWNVMHAVHRVCFKREAERGGRWRGGGEEVGGPSVEETGRRGARCSRWGLLLLLLLQLHEKDEAEISLPTPSLPSIQQKIPSSIKLFLPSSLGGKLSMTIHHGCLVCGRAEEKGKRGEGRREMEERGGDGRG